MLPRETGQCAEGWGLLWPCREPAGWALRSEEPPEPQASVLDVGSPFHETCLWLRPRGLP